MTEGLDFFLGLERKVWEALSRGDAAADASLLADNFLGVYYSGFASKAEHVAQLSEGSVVSRFELETPRLVRLSPTLALLAYRAQWRDAKGSARSACITSIWERGSEGWRNIFSQDTEARK